MVTPSESKVCIGRSSPRLTRPVPRLDQLGPGGQCGTACRRTPWLASRQPMKDTQPYGTYAPAGLVARIAERTGRIPPGTWHGRRLALFLRRIAISLLRGHPLDVERFGARMRLHPYNNNCEKKVL